MTAAAVAVEVGGAPRVPVGAGEIDGVGGRVHVHGAEVRAGLTDVSGWLVSASLTEMIMKHAGYVKVRGLGIEMGRGRSL